MLTVNARRIVRRVGGYRTGVRLTAGSRAVLLAPLILTAVTGCGASDDPALARTQHFVRALESGDDVGACADLAEEARASLEDQEQKPCADVIGEQDLPTAEPRDEARVYGSMAQVHTGADTVFLSRFSDGWRIVGVGCTPGPGDEPYTCTVEVG